MQNEPIIAWHPRDLVTLTEAAERLGLRNLADYRKKYATFPKPYHARPQLWRWENIASWYLTTITPRTKGIKE